MVKGYCTKCKCQADHIHRFPENQDRARKWAENMQWTEEFTKLLPQRMSPRGITICSRHFAISSYNNNSRTEGLRYGAMPEIVVPIHHYDHDYMDVSHPTMEEVHRDTEDMEVTEVHAPPTPSAQTSYQTTCSQGSVAELYFDRESQAETKRREDREKKNMLAMKNRNSMLSHSSFLELISLSPGCLKCRNIDAVRTFKTVGCVLVMEVSCPQCKKWKWSSTKAVHEDKVGSYLEGNMNLSVATFTSGIPYERVVDMCNILEMGITRKSSHYQIIRENMKPVIQQMYLEDLDDVRVRLHSRYQANNSQAIPLSVIGDAQYDTRGFCAGICRYALLDDGTRYIIEHQIEARKDNNGNSPAMEAKALAQIMCRLTQDKQLNIVQLTTDKNSAVVSHMRKAHPSIRHRLDKWHVLKNFKKNNKHAIDLKRNANLRAHWDHLLVHIWYSIEAADGNGELAVELIRSAEYHLQNLHDLPRDQFDLIRQCTHGQLDPSQDKAYLDPVKHKEQIRVLHDMLNSPTFMDNVRVCAARETTSPCESFNSLVALIYIKKNYYYDKATTSTLMQLAIMHHNGHRKEVLDKEARGIIPPTRRKYSKTQGRYVEVTNQPKPKLTWKVELLARVKEHYRMLKTSHMQVRVTGRPPLLPTSPSIGDDDDDSVDGGSLAADDVPLGDTDVSDDETEEELDLDNIHDQEIEDATPFNAHVVTTTVIPLQPPAVTKPVIRCSERQFPIVYASKGTNADLFTYVNNRTGVEMLPITQ